MDIGRERVEERREERKRDGKRGREGERRGGANGSRVRGRNKHIISLVYSLGVTLDVASVPK